MVFLRRLAKRLARSRSSGMVACFALVVACAGDPADPAVGPSATFTQAAAPPATPTPPPSSSSCLSQWGPLTILNGAKSAYDIRATSVANQKIDASTASWTGTASYPVEIGNPSAPGICWSGGSIAGTFSPSTPQSTWHGYIGLFLASPSSVLEDLHIRDYGDGVRVYDNANNWTIRRSHIERAHDDCVEDDRLYAGLLDDSYFECYVFLSERPGQGTGIKVPVDGTGKTVTIQNSLVYMHPMPTVYRGPAPGTGPMFKWPNDGHVPTAVTITNTIFRVDQPPSHGHLDLPPNLACSGNTMVWLGQGEYPVSLPSCFTVTTDKGVWDRAVADWEARHPGS